ncbi:MAG: 3-oxoacyl-[acyl-carrier protein] reductase [Rhodopila sp.]|nr:3-oxoacyl-[acyl-carrier protein] reductase [Rhodopila sp.]
MTDRVAIVTGGLRGLGRGMTLGLAATGVRVLAVGHLPEDVAAMEGTPNVRPMIADLRSPEACDRVVAEALAAFGRLDILVNNAGLTFTYIDPARFRRETPRKFWEVKDEVIQNVMDTNYVAADQMGRRVAPILVKQDWGRIINVTTKLDTMNREGSVPYGSSKAALEMTTEIWAKEMVGTGVTVNIVNPGAGANTPGMNQELRDWSREGKVPRLVEPDEMVPPLLYVVSEAADAVNGYRFDALTWDASLPPTESARRNGRPAGFVLHPQDEATFPAG